MARVFGSYARRVRLEGAAEVLELVVVRPAILEQVPGALAEHPREEGLVDLLDRGVETQIGVVDVERDRGHARRRDAHGAIRLHGQELTQARRVLGAVVEGDRRQSQERAPGGVCG
ncbi:MAG: hypothetical protein MZV64_42340 [Ignavibacteriales bacterium]|nr:hypothetical protein [Ignavibacteriales bacterium]